MKTKPIYKRRFVDDNYQFDNYDDDSELFNRDNKLPTLFIGIAISVIFSFLIWIFLYLLIKFTWFT